MPVTPARTARTRSAASRSTRKLERLEARVSAEQKALLQRAAALQGRTLSDFLVGSAQQAAEQAILTHDVMTLTGQASLVFAEALLHPPAANERLRVAFARSDEDQAPDVQAR